MKTIVITGSTSGLGLEMAKNFLDAGFNVTISGRSKNMPETLKKDIIGFNDNVLYVHSKSFLYSTH